MGNFVYGEQREVVDNTGKSGDVEVAQENVDMPQKAVNVPKKTGMTKSECDDGVWKITVLVGIESVGDTTESSCEFPVYIPMFTEKTAEQTIKDCDIILDTVPGYTTYGEIYNLFENLAGNFTIPPGDERQLHASNISIGKSQFSDISKQVQRIARKVREQLSAGVNNNAPEPKPEEGNIADL